MIIERQDDVTAAVLAEMHRTPDARTKEILESLVTHLHAFVRDVRLTEKEFQEAIGYLNAIGQKTTPSHNEAMLLAGALGVSNLVCLLNNAHPTQANNLGPFYRAGAPRPGAIRRLDARFGCLARAFVARRRAPPAPQCRRGQRALRRWPRVGRARPRPDRLLL